MVWNEKQMGLPPGLSGLDFREEGTGTEGGHGSLSWFPALHHLCWQGLETTSWSATRCSETSV